MLDKMSLTFIFLSSPFQLFTFLIKLKLLVCTQFFAKIFSGIFLIAQLAILTMKWVIYMKEKYYLKAIQFKEEVKKCSKQKYYFANTASYKSAT